MSTILLMFFVVHDHNIIQFRCGKKVAFCQTGKPANQQTWAHYIPQPNIATN